MSLSNPDWSSEEDRNNVLLVTACVLVFVVAVIVLIIVKGIQDGGSCKSRDAWNPAAIEIQRYVKLHLNAPGSARFPFFKPRYVGNSLYKANSYVDTLNAFGGPIRLYFNTTIECVEMGHSRGWRIVNFGFL